MLSAVGMAVFHVTKTATNQRHILVELKRQRDHCENTQTGCAAQKMAAQADHGQRISRIEGKINGAGSR